MVTEGIEFYTHKIGEGLNNTDETAQQALNSARAAGIRVLGAYYFIHSGDMVAQAQRCIDLANQMVPWWKTFDGWFWQTDAETDTAGHLPSPTEVKLFSDTLALRSGKRVIVYASHGMYGDSLTGLNHLLWNANYPSNRTGGFKDLYPGDTYSGWRRYSGQTPILAQYTSKATIAGLTTCDANAFRGTIDELLNIINPGGNDMTAPTPEQNAHELMMELQVDGKGWTGKQGVSAGTDLGDGANAAREARDLLKAGGTGGTVDIPALVEALRPVIADEIDKALNATKLTHTVILNQPPAG